MKLHEALLDADFLAGKKYIEQEGHCGVAYVKQWRLVVHPARSRYRGAWTGCEERIAFDGDDFSGPKTWLGQPHAPWKHGTFEYYEINNECKLVEATPW